MVEAILLNGRVGAGKTTTAAALSDLLGERRTPHAWVDLDQIRLLFPAPAGDPFQHEVELANLRDVARNYRSAGAARLILAGVVESPTEVPRYLAALGVGTLLICRLLVEPDVARTRLAARHADDPVQRRWHLRRTAELTRVLDQASFDEVTVDTTRRSPLDVAYEVAHHAGWLPDIPSPR